MVVVVAPPLLSTEDKMCAKKTGTNVETEFLGDEVLEKKTYSIFVFRIPRRINK